MIELLIKNTKQLVNKKRKTSSERKEYKTSNEPQSWEYQSFFQRSDEERKDLREKIRFLHLARNFTKKTPYKKVEEKVSDENRLLSGPCRKLYLLIEQYIPEVFSEKDVRDWVGYKDED